MVYTWKVNGMSMVYQWCANGYTPWGFQTWGIPKLPWSPWLKWSHDFWVPLILGNHQWYEHGTYMVRKLYKHRIDVFFTLYIDGVTV
jgi:hypothetical protein